MDEVEVSIQVRCPYCGHTFSGSDEARVRFDLQRHDCSSDHRNDHRKRIDNSAMTYKVLR